MSYCRVNDSGSDVYIFGSSGNLLECWLSSKVAQDTDLPQAFFSKSKDIVIRNKTMLGHILFLEDQGIKVPPHVKRRLLNEIDEHTERATFEE